MRWKHIDFLEMCSSAVDDLDMRKANGRAFRQCNPQVPLAAGLL